MPLCSVCKELYMLGAQLLTCALGTDSTGFLCPALLPALAPVRGIPLGARSASRASDAALAAPGSLRAALPHAQGIEIQRLALDATEPQ